MFYVFAGVVNYRVAGNVDKMQIGTKPLENIYRQTVEQFIAGATQALTLLYGVHPWQWPGPIIETATRAICTHYITGR